MQFRPTFDRIEARQFVEASLEDQQALASWCRGRLRGTKIPAADRVIQIDIHEVECEAQVGDWIVYVKGHFFILPEPQFNIMFCSTI